MLVVLAVLGEGGRGFSRLAVEVDEVGTDRRESLSRMAEVWSRLWRC